MRAAVEWMERHQVPLYLASLAVGAALGLAWGDASRLVVLVEPVLALLLYATFLAVPFRRVREAFADRRFLRVVAGINFVVVPLVTLLWSRLVADDRVLLIGVLFVLLAPCIDYVIVFTGLAGGNREKLLAATPLLMVGQVLLLPLFLWLMAGSEIAAVIDVAPFVRALVLLLVLPLGAAALTQAFADRHRPARRGGAAVLGAMVPLMCATLVLVVASQIGGVGQRLGDLLLVAGVFALFALTMVVVGSLLVRRSRLAPDERVAAVLSGVTRNSLVVLPLVLALPPGHELAAIVVVTQTLVELLVLVVLVRVLPRLLSETTATTAS